MATFVLVHGAWHGGWCWQRVTPLLRRAECEVYTPTLTGLGERAHLLSPQVDLETHIKDVAAVLEYEDLRDVVLVGHSNAGMVITGVADRLPERLAQLVYLDAMIPEDGRSFLDLFPPELAAMLVQGAQEQGDGWRVPPFPLSRWSITEPADLNWLVPRLGVQPLRTLDQPIHLRGGSVDSVGRTFIRCVGNPASAWLGDWARAQAGWRYRELPCSHEAMVTHPTALAGLLLELS